MKDLPAWANVLVFAVAAIAIWWAGSRLERHADGIARSTRLGQAFTGVLLLAAATSLPELAATIVAIVVLDNPTLAAHNLLGGVALQTALLVVADRAMRRGGALTSFRPRFVLLIQGVGLLLLLQIVIAGFAADGVPVVLATSVWTPVLFLAYVALMYLTYRHRDSSRWSPTGEQSEPGGDDDEAESSEPDPSLPKLIGKFIGASVLVLVAGYAATTTADALAEQSGLGSAFVGATLLALATSLPEVSTTFSAARHQRTTMAMSNIFGSNAFDVALLFLADLLYRKDAIMRHIETTAVFVATIGAIMTCIYLWGLLEREDRTVLGVGWDSAAAGLTYAGGMAVLYLLS